MSDIDFVQHAMVFSKSTHGEINLVSNFKVKEFACSDGSDVVLIHPFIPFICQMVRNKFKYAYSPNSAYRTPTHNKAVGGAINSNHLYGRAVDIPAKKGVTPKQLYDYVDTLFGDWGEVGLYSWGVHVGVQESKKRFVDSSYKG